MTSAGIVGAGRAATLHAEAVRAAAGVRLAGVAARSTASPRAAALAAALDCPVLTARELARACDVAVVATPPAARAEALAELASSRRLRAVLVESPAATTVDGIADLGAAFGGRPVMAAVNLLHAPAVRRMLDAVAAMDPHHLELRLAVPEPARGPDSGAAFGGGVTMDPAAGFWPVLMAAMGEAIESVAVPQIEVVDGLDHAARVVLQTAGGRTARAELRWGAQVAEAAVEAADSEHAARVDVWPVPAAEINGEAAGPPADLSDPLFALGFVAQTERLVRAANGEAQPWPDLAVASSALTIAAAASLSAQQDGIPVSVSDVPRGLSPFEMLAGTRH
ncbi:MAG: Gfo/Idh/MocA family oxidoreductase [Gemmatimonadota bacterium]|nr:Gfo/Idh/MocA family oxidoreductase [Gemmatimonadota bacterium]